MAGKRQHFVPRFLQEGFASHQVGDQAFTWVYRTQRPSFNSNISNVGVEGNFYSDGDDSSADELITKAERRYSKLISELRLSGPGPVTHNDLPELIVHFETRTRHLRKSFLESGTFVVDRLLEFLSDERKLEEFLLRRLRSDPSLIRNALKRDFDERLLEPILSLIEPLFPLMVAAQKSQIAGTIARLRGSIDLPFAHAAKLGHVKALRAELAPAVRLERLQGLKFRIEPMEAEPLNLGDSIVVFRVGGTRAFKTFLEKGDDLEAVLLPISSRLLLVGARVAASLPSDLNDVVARCSLEYFIASQNGAANDRRQTLIGSDAAILSKSELEEIITSVLNE